MKVPTTTVVDEVPYAEPSDILDRYIRNRDAFTDPGEETVYSMLLDRTDMVDSETGRAWRRRRLEHSTRPELKFSSQQKNPRKRKRARTRTGGGRRRLSPQRRIDPWVDATLTFHDVHSVEELVVVRGRETTDITSEGPTDIQADPGPVDGGEWWIQADRGRLKVDLHNFVRGEQSITGRLVTTDASLRITYAYGFDESDNVTAGSMNDPSDSVPGDIRDAVAKLVAADIAETDQYGSIFRESSGEAELSDTADALRQDALNEINSYRRF